MPTFFPVEVLPRIKTVDSNVIGFDWLNDPRYGFGVAATVYVPRDPDALIAIRFSGQCIVRLLDEMAHSTEEENGPNKGLDGSLLYRVEGSRFFEQQSRFWADVPPGKAAQYAIITGWTCLDVVAFEAPEVFVVSASDDVSWRVPRKLAS